MGQKAKIVPKTSAKKIITAIYFLVLFHTGFTTFLRIGSERLPSLYVNGFTIVATVSLFLLYTVFANRKKFYFIASLIIFLGFGYTFYTVYSIYGEMVRLELGFYLYVTSFILLIVSLFFPMQETQKPVKKESEIKKEALDKNMKEQSQDNYMVGTYRFGIKGKPELSNHLCAITTNKDCKDIVLIIAANEEFRYEIKHEQVEKITVKSGTTLSSEETSQVEDHSVERAMLASALLGAWGPMIAESIGSLGGSEKVNYQVTFTVEIYYKLNEETKKIVLTCHDNPDHFFGRFPEFYQKAS